MSTKPEVAETPVEEFEFDHPCGIPGCENDAKWMGWASHTSRGCPNMSYACDRCKAIITKWWVELAALRKTMRCTKCREVIANSPPENIRWIKL